MARAILGFNECSNIYMTGVSPCDIVASMQDCDIVENEFESSHAILFS